MLNICILLANIAVFVLGVFTIIKIKSKYDLDIIKVLNLTTRVVKLEGGLSDLYERFPINDGK